MSTETTNKKIKIDNGTTFGRTYTDKAVDERLQGLVSTATFTPVKEKANNSLQKPKGLTKTELVGVGTNGQENIEIGDNLTLANGKLSATVRSSSEVNIIEGTVTSTTDNIMNFTVNKDIDLNKVNILFIDNQYMIINMTYNNNKDNCGYFNYIGHEDALITGNISGRNGSASILYNWFSLNTYHFITMTNSSSNVVLYLTIQNAYSIEFNAAHLASYLEGKKVLVNGNLHGVVPTYIAGEGGVIKVYYMNPGDSNINPTPDEYQDLSSFTITDLVTSVE